MSIGSKPVTTTGLPYSRGDEVVGARADHRRDVARRDEAVELQAGRVEDRAQRRRDRARGCRRRRSCAIPLGAGAQQRDRRRRRGRLEADREEDDLAVGVARGRARARRAASRPSARRRRAPSPRAASPRPPGTRSMSPKVVKITSGRSASAIASSTRPIGITQTGQPGPWTKSTSGGTRSSSPCW